MSLTARHKKPGAFEKLVNSLEITSPSKRDTIVASMKAEDPVFMDRVLRSMMTFEEIKAQPESILMEVLHHLGSMQYLALALYKLEDQQFVDKIMKCMIPKQIAQYRDFLEELNQVTKGQREGAQFKLIEAARMVEQAKGIKIKPYLAE